jgi:Tfp pilus assembly protein PilF
MVDSFYGAKHYQSLHRPVAFFSFALNWLWGEDNVIGYHLVNIGIHVLTAIFLFLTILLLFRTPNAGDWDKNSIYFIALLSATLWAIHPIQIQAVTYIVQRMASMAALFYIISIFCYLNARMTVFTRHRLMWAVACAVAFLLGIGSKNNAIMLPVILLLIEFIFFRNLSEKKTQKQAVFLLIAGGTSVAAFGFFVFMEGNFSRYFKELYEMRPFSMYERLLTQPRVMLFYLFQIFYPIVNQFNIEHVFTVSTSLFTPWTTFPSILLIISLNLLAFWRIKKNPILSFAILFYFGNHVIESTIIPLEMVFEHRNYLPTLFLFFPISIGIKKLFDYYYKTKKPMFYFFVISICAVMIGLGTSTYIRNWDWRSDKSLCEDALKKAPQSSRAAHNLAYSYYAPTGQTEKALELYQKALDLAGQQTIFKADIYNNIAALYYSPLKEYEKAVEYAKKAIAVYPHDNYKLLLYEALSMIAQYDQALLILDEVIENEPNNTSLLHRKGFILLKKGEPDVALKYFQQCLRQFPDSWKYQREIGLCHTQMKNYKTGYWFLKRAIAMRPQSVGILLGLAGNRIRAGYPAEADPWIEQFIERMGVSNIENFLIEVSEDPLRLPVFFDGVVSLISQNIRERSEKYVKIAGSLENRFSNNFE